jgi:hypothetical protein
MAKPITTMGARDTAVDRQACFRPPRFLGTDKVPSFAVRGRKKQLACGCGVTAGLVPAIHVWLP